MELEQETGLGVAGAALLGMGEKPQGPFLPPKSGSEASCSAPARAGTKCAPPQPPPPPLLILTDVGLSYNWHHAVSVGHDDVLGPGLSWQPVGCLCLVEPRGGRYIPSPTQVLHPPGWAWRLGTSLPPQAQLPSAGRSCPTGSAGLGHLALPSLMPLPRDVLKALRAKLGQGCGCHS